MTPTPFDKEIDEILDRFHNLHDRFNGENVRDWNRHIKTEKNDAKQAIKQAIATHTDKAVEKARRESSKRLLNQIARYGDGVIVHFNQEAVVPISKILAELSNLYGSQHGENQLTIESEGE